MTPQTGRPEPAPPADLPLLTPEHLRYRCPPADRCSDRGSCLLLLDYDGTLVPIASTPVQARPPARLLALLALLIHHPRWHVAVVSGRSLADLRALLPVPGLWLVGEHGGAIASPEGAVRWAVPPEAVAPALTAMQATTLALLAGEPGFILEAKNLSLALHYRQAPPNRSGPVLAAVEELWLTRAAHDDLVLLRGKCVLEVRPRGLHKGNACRSLLLQHPSALGIYLGDDSTDEDAFQAVAAAGGITVLVGAARPTAAQYRLPDPETVLSLLEVLVGLRRAPAERVEYRRPYRSSPEAEGGLG